MIAAKPDKLIVAVHCRQVRLLLKPFKTAKEGLHNPFPARRAVCCPRCNGGEDAGTSVTVLFEPWQRAFAETHGVCARVFHALRSALRVIHRLPSANSVVIWAVFFIRPRYRVFVYPNCRLMIRNGCSTLARTPAFRRSI